jgi:DNA-binding NarL/FixJ family response regulator
LDPIRVLLADDHTLFRKGIHTLLEQMQGIEVELATLYGVTQPTKRTLISVA